MIILARPTLSLALYMQMLGRGVRLAEGKKHCSVFDLVGNHSKFGNFENVTVEEVNGKYGIYNGNVELTNIKHYAKQ
jgi:DNA repair protein RadD